MKIPILNELIANGTYPEILFWIGCAGNYDARAQKITRAFCEILNNIGYSYAVLGDEEKCTGDPARRAGNEFLFQMLAIQNIETLNQYQVKKIVCTCPHCFNTLKNEYPELGGNYEVIHYSQFLEYLISTQKIVIKPDDKKAITYHDSCYLGRINGVYEAPRSILNALEFEILEMKRSKENGLCCGAGGAQMFKEEESGVKRVNAERVEEALQTGANTMVANCPFCITMLQDGIKEKNQQDHVMVYDLAELILQNQNKV
ncbi:MAG: (Fe-S)-binding protein [Saprospiraceae bacterium]|nr:(Fe-S)-binding protein [Saprospiraceae bacterium]MBK9221513.1 (Fe-S)-binding protein [Saprospiraceae bacterium]MBK9721549.1 (Fe-S)-binding protein [Saprospiraceae bacterium]MBK9728614.1 (Fe-S)-binding protein [Saprospiraceae bacterium]